MKPVSYSLGPFRGGFGDTFSLHEVSSQPAMRFRCYAQADGKDPPQSFKGGSKTNGFQQEMLEHADMLHVL